MPSWLPDFRWMNMSAECVLERMLAPAEWSNHFILQKRKCGPERELTCPKSHSTRPNLESRSPDSVLYVHGSAPPACLPSFSDTWIPSQKPSQRSSCKYFPPGLQVSKVPFLPCSFRQFTLPFSKQISILIKAFITIIHLSLQGIRQLQSADWLSHHKPSPPLLAGGGVHINRTFH